MDKVRRKTYLDKTDESYSLLNNDSLQMGRFFLLHTKYAV